jgi:hypothetical protein
MAVELRELGFPPSYEVEVTPEFPPSGNWGVTEIRVGGDRTVFQALFIKGLMGARIARRWSRLSCLNSSRWNGVMAGMAAVMVTWIDAGPDRHGAGGL